MRTSVNKNDPGYKNLVHGTTVFLDDKEIKDVFTADEELGLVVVARRNESGQIFLIGDEVAKQTVNGKIRIQLPK